MKKNKILIHIILVVIAVQISAVFSYAKIGIDAKLYTPSLFVSRYDDVEDKISFALLPKTYPYLSTWLAYRPRAISSNFSENSIRFETQYWGVGRDKFFRVPVSVDAKNYNTYRLDKLMRKTLNENFNNSINKEEQKKSRSGLGVQVALPKRFEKIFGEGSAGLKISGKRKISFAGRSNWTDQATTGAPQSKFPSLVMDQVSRFNITGNIGSKITVKVSQDSQTDIPLSNRIQIRYFGDEDDVLKTIEAGNTTLSLPRTEFVGYSSTVRGLFGIKSEAQVGNLKITAIASQEKGSSETTSITAGGQESVEFVRDYEYVERRIFDLVLPFEKLKSTEKITKLLMYESVPNYNAEGDQLFANFYADPEDTLKYAQEAIKGNQTIIKPIDQNRYTYYNRGVVSGVPYVVFSTPQSRTINIGYYMEITDTVSSNIRTVGSTTETLTLADSAITGIDTLTTDPLTTDTTFEITERVKPVYRLKVLVRADNLYRPADVTWQLMWRNCYEVPKGVDIVDVNFKVFKGLEGSERNGSGTFSYQGDESNAVDFLEILGLDLRTTSGTTTSPFPDGIVDDIPSIYRSDWGLVIFPSRTPFNDTTTYTTGPDNAIKEIPPLEIKVPELYKFNSWEEKSKASQYFIQKTTTSKGSVISLNRANIIEGSERITAGGELLTAGVDYDISYSFGQVTLRSEKATDPNAEIKIDFEYAPFFAVQKKSLVGLRAEYEWSKDLEFGSTFLYKSDKAQERKPKVGQETARTVIFDADFSLKLYPNFLTTMVDAIPLIEADQPSTLTIEGEIAQSHPNPNVNDIAYVDDFETALDNVALGTFRNTWKIASKPLQIQNQNFVQSKLLWHRPVQQTLITDIYDRDTQAGTGQMNTFRMIFRPTQHLKYPDSTNVKSWGGIMRAFGSPLQENRVKLFEVRMKGRTGKIHLDFGVINEDVNDNGNADTEDLDNSNTIDAEGKEDTGLDLLPDAEEPGYDPVTNPDPNGDDFYSFYDSAGVCPLPNGDCGVVDKDDINNPIYYDFLNGTEGNAVDAGTGRAPDKESYSSSFTDESQSTYFSFVIDLDNDRDRFLVPGSEIYPEVQPGDTSTPEPWVTYRIPIKDPANLDGIYSAVGGSEPKWDDIRHIRIWMEADETQIEPDTVEIADWYFVQPNWKDSVIVSPLSNQKTKFVVSSVSDDVDSAFYPPPNVESYKDPASGVVEVQRALQLEFDDLNHFDTCIAIKDLLTIDQYSGYRHMEMYVHGDEMDNQNIGDVEFFFRLGRDSDNYYEYYTSIVPGWDESNHVDIDFNELTALKDSALKVLPNGEVLNASNNKYRIHGRPNVNEVKFLAVGVINKNDTIPISGKIWIDELRVTDVRKDVGTAGRIKASGPMSDFITYNFQLKSSDPYFRGMSSATRGGSDNNLGSGQSSTYLTSNLTFRLQKFLPRSWNANIPVSLAYSKTVRTPLLRNNSDIVLPEEIRLEEQKVSETKSVTVNTKFSKKTSNPVFSVILNRLSTVMSYRLSTYKDVNTPYQYGEVIDFKANYNLNIAKTPKIPIFSLFRSIPLLKKTANSELQLYPQNWTMNGRFVRNLSITDKLNANRRSSLQRTFDGGMSLDFKFFENLNVKYDYDTKRDLSDLDLINFTFSRNAFKLGIEQRYSQRFSASYDPQLFKFFTSSFSYKSSYVDDWEGTNQSRRSALTNSVAISGKFDHQALLGGKGTSRDRGFKKRSGRTKNVIEEENKKDKKLYDPLLSGVRKVTGWIDPIGYSYSTNYNNSLPGMVTRPNYKYLFGLTRDADVQTVEDIRQQNSGEGETYDISSGFTLLGGVVTTVKYRKSITRDLVRTGSLSENESVNWPDLNIRIQKFKNLPLIQKYVNKFIDVFSPRTGYSKSVKESRDITYSDSVFTTSKSTSIGYNPLISVNFKLFRSLSLNTSVTKTINTSENYNLGSNLLQYTTTTTNQTFALTAKYSFSSPQGISIPLFGRMKFNSTVDISMNVKFNSSKTENDNVVGKDNVTKDDSSISFNPVVAYSFSRQITGGITMRWQDNKGLTSNRHTREVQLWTEITF